LKKDDAEARNSLVAIYVKKKKYDDIISLLKENVEIAPSDPNSHYKLGLIYEFKKDYEAATAEYKKSVELKKDHAKALNAMGRVYLKTGRFAEAKEALETAKKADPGLEETSVLLSNIKDELSPEPQLSRKRYHGKSAKSKHGKAYKKGSKSSKSSKGSKAKKAGKAKKQTATAGKKKHTKK
jgi:tetratricopeptide (TPR) repeat protein